MKIGIVRHVFCRRQIWSTGTRARWREESSEINSNCLSQMTGEGWMGTAGVCNNPLISPTPNTLKSCIFAQFHGQMVEEGLWTSGPLSTTLGSPGAPSGGHVIILNYGNLQTPVSKPYLPRMLWHILLPCTVTSSEARDLMEYRWRFELRRFLCTMILAD